MRKFAMFCFSVVLSLSIAEQLFAQGTRSTDLVLRPPAYGVSERHRNNAGLIARDGCWRSTRRMR